MVKIRMKSFGRRHRPFYRICVMDARTPRDGRAIEELGWYDPLVRNESAREWFNTPRVRYWLSVGAQPTEKVAAMLKRHGITKPGNGEPWDDVPAQERPAAGAKTTFLTGGPAPKAKAAPPAPEPEAPAEEAPAPAAEEPKAEESQP
jgi:small subunit ribosomal protein S16